MLTGLSLNKLVDSFLQFVPVRGFLTREAKELGSQLKLGQGSYISFQSFRHKYAPYKLAAELPPVKYPVGYLRASYSN